jgi:hypothetical protein
MPRLGIVAEGLPNSDVLVISELMKKMLSHDISFCLKPGGSRGNVIKKYRGWLEDFRRENVEKALVIVDQHMSCIKGLVEKMHEKIQNRRYSFSVKFHVITQAIETWLFSSVRLAD